MNPTTSRFVAWCEEYCTTHGIKLSRLALDAGLSAGTLLAYRRSNKKPEWETVLKVASATGADPKYLAELAELPEADKLTEINPLRSQLLAIFDKLPLSAQRGLLALAKTLQQVVSTVDKKDAA
ncbi:MAG: hypothetical protein WC832_02070 [Anaerolineales bacterium]